MKNMSGSKSVRGMDNVSMPSRKMTTVAPRASATGNKIKISTGAGPAPMMQGHRGARGKPSGKVC